MNILVTGGAGYIGSVTVEALLARGHRVVVLDNLGTGHRGAVHPDAAFVLADLRDVDRVAHTLEEHAVDAVVHFAASSLVGESMQVPLKYYDNNVAGSMALLQAVVRGGVDRFVFSSTAALYGTPDETPIPESAPIRPESVYGSSKQMVEGMLQWLAATEGLGYAALRYFNAAGASARFGEDHQPETHLIPLVLQVALGQREEIAIFGDDYPTPDGTAVRDYVHVLDLAEAHVRALEALAPGEARSYNLGNGAGFSVREVIDVCRVVTGCDIPAEIAARRPGDPPSLVADTRRIHADLGWTPQHADLDEIVRSAWAWHREHPEGYAS